MNDTSQDFVMHFGEMGSRWGFNRTVGQMFALLVISPRPLNADQIASDLKISRGNVSMGLKELQSWRVIKLHREAGDRKDYFTVAGSIFELAQIVFEERRKRELDPTLSLLRDSLLQQPQSEDAKFAHQQMQEIHDLLELLLQWTSSLNSLTPSQLQGLMKLGAGVSKVIDLKDRLGKTDSRPNNKLDNHSREG